MLLTAIILVLLSNSILSQGVFEPYIFTQSSCAGSYQWTTWFDTNNPNLIQGDVELTSHIQRLFPGYMCLSPIAIEARTSFDGNPRATGDVFRISLRDGFLCLNQQVTNYRSRLCCDYKVRYCCPFIIG